MQPVQCMLLFLVLAVNSTLFRFLRSYIHALILITRSCLLPSSNKLRHFTSQPFVSSLHCMYNMHNTRPHPCNHANRVNGVNEYTFHMGHPSGFEDTVSLDVSLKMLNALYLTSIFCVLCTVFSL